ncbi:group I intron-associated PD-(D/E)XK endonuclease [Thiomicrorhabdus sp.]|uniref:group I intron-associated PD-(D/E)XK endonuclease n=1 Tax=Thiomicrorhabdus sp. TaxID=2039724 RepID=UPI002AA5FAC7|nr:group I intron-associated PD-(D/E)XK endonuclease [Thiomicrorhabdus sp.]
MPVINHPIKKTTLAAHKQLSYEQLASAWLSSDGWEVLIPAIDHGKKTDLVVADDSNYYRIQIKSIETNDESVSVENKWKGSKIDYVIYFSRSADWGYIAPAFEQCKKRLNSEDHIRFHAHPKHFLKAFKQI